MIAKRPAEYDKHSNALAFITKAYKLYLDTSCQNPVCASKSFVFTDIVFETAEF